MLNNWFITIVVLVVVLALITYVICQNKKEAKQEQKRFDSEFPDPEFINEEKGNEQ